MEDVQKRKIGVLLLFGLLIVAGISPILNEATGILTNLLDPFKDVISTVNDGDGGGGGGGIPDSSGDGGES
ncbi:MAG: hypothetical protein HXS46_15590 [Theionarchaea archaeon]|nr:hypothetical protein [Theionarchaea archaeon]